MENTTRMDKYIFRTSSAVVVILALAAAILSYSALKQLAVLSGIDPILSYLFPLVLDGLILSGTLLVLYFAVRGVRSKFGIFLTLLGVAASIAGNVAVSDNNVIHQMVHGAPALVLFLSLEALTILLRTKSKAETEESLRQEDQNSPQKASGADNAPTIQTQPTNASESQNEEHKEPEPVTPEPVHTYEPITYTEEPTPPVRQEIPLLNVEEEKDAPQRMEEKSSSHDSFIMDQYPVNEVTAPSPYERSLTDTTPAYFSETVPSAHLSEERSSLAPEAPEVNDELRTSGTSFGWEQDYEPVDTSTETVNTPTKKTEPTKSKTKVAQNNYSEEENVLDYLGEDIPGETKKEKIEWLLSKFPDAKPVDVVKVIGGDGSYIRKIVRDIRN